MRLEQLRIHNLRCYDEASIDFDPKFNVVVGLNGQGKTSLLEAVGLLAFFKSFRGAKNAEMLRVGAEEGRIHGQVRHENITFDLDVKLWAHRKQALFNGKSCRLLSEIVGKLSAVSFAPTDLEIVRGSPENRRNWIDRLTQVLTPTHVDDVAAYQKTLDQRNRLLKEFAAGRTPRLSETFEVWTEQLTELGGRIAFNRICASRECKAQIAAHYRRISGKEISLNLQYFREGSDELAGGQEARSNDTFYSPDDLQTSLKKMLDEALPKDKVLGTTTVGPHRDDLEILMAGQPAKAFGSQGEVRSLVLAMRLAEVEKHREVKGISPLLLIDDFSSELDHERRGFLLDWLVGGDSQVFLTTTEPIRMGKVFTVTEGKIG